MGVTGPQIRHWTRDEYGKMTEAGILAPGERVELIEGEVVEMTRFRWRTKPFGPPSGPDTMSGNNCR